MDHLGLTQVYIGDGWVLIHYAKAMVHVGRQCLLSLPVVPTRRPGLLLIRLSLQVGVHCGASGSDDLGLVLLEGEEEEEASAATHVEGD